MLLQEKWLGLQVKWQVVAAWRLLLLAQNWRGSLAVVATCWQMETCGASACGGHCARGGEASHLLCAVGADECRRLLRLP